MDEIKTKQYFLSGVVQGVCLRDFVVTEAKALDINGWVRNRTDGRVEIIAQSLSDKLDTFEKRLEAGPPLASIDKVDSSVLETPIETYFDFKKIETL